MKRRTPDFENNLLKVLQKKKPAQGTLFELFLNHDFYCRLAGREPAGQGTVESMRLTIDAMAAAGYDHAPTFSAGLVFRQNRQKESTASLNGDALIYDWASFESFRWPDFDAWDDSHLQAIKPFLPEGMTLMAMGPNGILENVIDLVGYDNLCILLFEEPELVQAIFDKVGSLLLKYYERSAQADTVGFLCANDDWGFNTQTFLSPADMRKYVFPWHKKIVDIAHKHNKPCILHSCGYYGEIVEDIITDLQFDARHSYEDNIISVEQAYEQFGGRIATLGGIDMHFLVTKTPEEVYARALAMMERTADRGAYALGSGNSIPAYVPFENFLALNRAALEWN